MNYFEKAKAKIEEQGSGLSGAAKSVFYHVQKALLEFCKQEDEFAQAIVENDKSISQCCTTIMKNCGNYMSDIDVYRKAVEFFFPGAKVEFQMKIDLIGEASVNHKVLKMKFSDFLGG